MKKKPGIYLLIFIRPHYVFRQTAWRYLRDVVVESRMQLSTGVTVCDSATLDAFLS